MSARPNLHVVGDQPPVPAPDPDKRLRALFKAEARLERQLLDVRREIAVERRRYADKHKLGCFPNLDTLRRIFA